MTTKQKIEYIRAKAESETINRGYIFPACEGEQKKLIASIPASIKSAWIREVSN